MKKKGYKSKPNPIAVELYRNGLFKEKSTPSAYELARRPKKFNKREALKYGKEYQDS